MKNTLSLKKNADFKRVYAKGSSTANKYVVFFWLKKRQNMNRVGFIASKKVGKSVIRNRARRLMKEAFRIYEENIDLGYDFIFIARHSIKDATYYDVKNSIYHVLRRSKVMK